MGKLACTAQKEGVLRRGTAVSGACPGEIKPVWLRSGRICQPSDVGTQCSWNKCLVKVE